MKDDRRARLAKLVETVYKGDRGKFMKASGLSKGRVSQLLDKDEPFGDVAALRLARKLGLRLDYFDRSDEQAEPPLGANESAPAYGPTPPPAVNPRFADPPRDTGWQVMHDLEDLHPDDKAAWIAELHRQAEKAREISKLHSARAIEQVKKGAKKA